MPDEVSVLVEGGKATPGPPLGPALGPLGVNVMQIVETINEKTKVFEGMKVPVKVIVETDKKFQVIVGTPPTSALILRELGLQKGSGKSKTEVVGNLTIAQVKKIANMKANSFLAKNDKKMMKEVIGTCVSMGITVEGKDPREFLKSME